MGGIVEEKMQVGKNGLWCFLKLLGNTSMEIGQHETLINYCNQVTSSINMQVQSFHLSKSDNLVILTFYLCMMSKTIYAWSKDTFHAMT